MVFCLCYACKGGGRMGLQRVNPGMVAPEQLFIFGMEQL